MFQLPIYTSRTDTHQLVIVNRRPLIFSPMLNDFDDCILAVRSDLVHH